MPISSKSYIHEPLAYKDPFDLKIMSQVLQFKQQKFDAGRAQVQSAIAQMAKLDVLADTDKKYLQEKINGVVDQINSLGGVDLSDANTLGRLGNSIGTITQDKRIMDAYADTMQIRSLTNGWQQAKTNPGKKGVPVYNAANESSDMEAVQNYKKRREEDPTVRYTGPSSPTPYAGTHEKLQKAFQGIVPDVHQQIQVDAKTGQMTIVSTKTVSSHRIREIMDATLTPDDMAQLQREAKYLYKGTTPEVVKQMSLANIKTSQDLTDNEIKAFETRRILSKDDPDALAAIDQNITSLQGRKKQLTEKYDKIASATDPNILEGEKMFMYQNNLYNGYINKHSYKAHDSKIQWNQYAMQQNLFEHQRQMANAKMAFEAQKIALGNQADLIDLLKDFTPESVAKYDAGGRKNPLDLVKRGKGSGEGGEGGEGGGSSSKNGPFADDGSPLVSQDISNPEEISAVAKGQVTAIKSNLDQQHLTALQGYMNDMTGKHPELRGKMQVGTYGPQGSTLKMDEKAFSTSDLYKAEYQAFKALENGGNPDATKLSPEFQNLAKKLNEIKIIKQAINQDEKTVRDQIRAEVGSTVKDFNYERYDAGRAASAKAMVTRNTGLMGTAETVIDRSKLSAEEAKAMDYYSKMKSQLGDVPDKAAAKAYEGMAKRLNFNIAYFGNEEVGRPDLKANVKTKAANYYYTKEGEKEPGEEFAMESIRPIGLVQRKFKDDKTVRPYMIAEVTEKDGSESIVKTIYVELDSSQIKSFGKRLEPSPNQYVEEYFQSGRILGGIQAVSGSAVVNSEIVKAEDGTFHINLLRVPNYKAGGRYENLPLPKVYSTATEAYQDATAIADMYSAHYQNTLKAIKDKGQGKAPTFYDYAQKVIEIQKQGTK